MQARTHVGVDTEFVVCVRCDGYEASLETRKIYRLVPDASAAEHDLVRVIDESGEDYLYPSSFFAPIEVPEKAARALASP